jgi:hypothetical protein
MMQDYDFNADSAPAVTEIPAPEEILKNILNFARSCQNVNAGGMTIRLFLN